jgi:Tfp pilus assembly protein PilV
MRYASRPLSGRAASYFRRIHKVGSSGDTIVEVMVSMAVLAIVVAATYSLSTRSFQSGQDSQYRDQAVSLAQQQLELIKESDNSNPQTITAYTNSPDTAYCIDPATKARRPADQCTFNNLYTVTYKYISATDTFQVAAAWDSSNGTRQQATIYYKPNDSFKDALQPPCQLDTDPLCSSTKTDVPAVGVHSSPPNPVIYGSAVTITWDYTNVQAGSCVPSSSPTNSAFNSVNPNSVNSFTSSSLPAGDDTFMITCRDNANNPVLGQVLVVISQPKIDLFTVNDVSGPGTVHIPYNTPVNVKWNSSGVTSCSASGPWSTGGATSGSVTTAAYTSNTTLGLTCTSSTGSTVTSPNINVVLITQPPPVISAFNTWSEPNIFTNQGAPRWLFWNSNASSCYLSNYGWVNPNSYVYINVYPVTYTLTCYNATGQSSSANFAFNYYHSYFIAYQNARFDQYWPGWQWGPVGEGYYGIPGDTSALSAYGRVAVRDNSGHCHTFQNVNYWQLYGWVEDYGLRNDNFGSADVGHDCGGN